MKPVLWNVQVREQRFTLRASSRPELLRRIREVLGEADSQVSVDAAPTVDCHAFFIDGDIRIALDRPLYHA